MRTIPIAIAVALLLGVGVGAYAADPQPGTDRGPGGRTTTTRPSPERPPAHRASKGDGKAMPSKLTQTARALLRSRMRWHVLDLQELIRSVVKLDFATAATLAKAISMDSSLARPLTGDASELNAQIPDRFFALQDQLRAVSGQLATSLSRGDAVGSSKNLGDLTATCVQCHAELAPDLRDRR